MALKPQTSFSSGELDPVMHDRVTLERYQNSLATARNVMVTKAGTIMSRFSRFHFKKSYYDNNPIKLFAPPNTNRLLEFGTRSVEVLPSVFQDQPYVVLYDYQGNVINFYDFATWTTPRAIYTPDELQNLHFISNKNYVYVFGGSKSSTNMRVIRINIDSPYDVVSSFNAFSIPNFSSAFAASYTGTATGYEIDYAITVVYNGQESSPIYVSFSPIPKKPQAAGESYTMIFTLLASTSVDERDSINEVRVYQRPREGSAYGFLGRTTQIYIDSGAIKAKFIDIGGDPDYSQGIQNRVLNEGLRVEGNAYAVGTGTFYQQRLILGNFKIGQNGEAIVASRPGFPNNLWRDFPYDSNSSLLLKAGSLGTAKILRMIDSDGLVVFTTVGVFVSLGLLGPNNLALTKRGNWIIDEDVPPLAIPGGLFFVDKTTNSVRQLVYSQELGSYDSIEQSIFSDHLFKYRKIKSWAYQEGVAPLIIVSFSDGEFATFTYNFEHQMRAWSRHDSKYPIEQVERSDNSDATFFVVNKNGTRYIDMSFSRFIPAEVYVENPEADISSYSAFMDSFTVKVEMLNDDLVGTDTLLLTPELDGTLTLECGTSAIFTDPGPGEVGTIFRWFHPIDRSIIDLEVVSRVDDNEIVVQPSEPFPEEYTYGVAARIYKTHTEVTGLNHLEGEQVAVISDGCVISSPFNDNEDEIQPILNVTGNTLTFPSGENSAITIVGRPICADIKTLNISTAEQSPTMIESLTANKMYIKTFESRGVFVANEFPENKIGQVDGTSVQGMQSLERYYEQDNVDIIGNRPKRPFTKRHEITLAGDYSTQGQVAVRQVDPLHFEIMSIILDIEIFPRSNR